MCLFPRTWPRVRSSRFLLRPCGTPTTKLEELHENTLYDKHGVLTSTGNDGVGNSDDGSDICSDSELQGNGSNQHGGKLYQHRDFEYPRSTARYLPRQNSWQLS